MTWSNDLGNLKYTIKTSAFFFAVLLLPSYTNQSLYAADNPRAYFLEITLPQETETQEADVLKLLDAAGIPEYFSAGNSFVYVNNFAGVEKVPLEEFDNRILPFDPRSDGYAEKLKNFFFHDGVTHIYIPYTGALSKAEAQIKDALAGVTYTLTSASKQKPQKQVQTSNTTIDLVYKVLFVLAAFATIWLTKSLAAVTLCVPLLLLFLLGANGALLAAILFICYDTWQQALGKICAQFFVKREGAYSIWKDINIYQLSVNTFITIFVYIIVCVYAEADRIIAFFTFPLFLLSIFITEMLNGIKQKKIEHAHFNPVSIDGSGISKFKFPVMCIPFLICVCTGGITYIILNKITSAS